MTRHDAAIRPNKFQLCLGGRWRDLSLLLSAFFWPALISFFERKRIKVDVNLPIYITLLRSLPPGSLPRIERKAYPREEPRKPNIAGTCASTRGRSEER